MQRVLVTGGAGFIGSHVVDVLLEKGYAVRVFDNLEPQVHGDIDAPPAYLSSDAEFVRGDVLDRPSLLAALRGCDFVIHNAAMVGVGQSQYQIERYVKANDYGTAVLLDLLVEHKLAIRKLVVASSMSIYGEGEYRDPQTNERVAFHLRPTAQLASGDFEARHPATGEVLVPVPTTESKPLDCASVYALSKKNQEEYVLLVGETHGIPTAAVRFFNVYGPRQSLSNPYTGVGAIFMSRLANGAAPLIYEDGLQSRDFLHVRDAAEAQVFAMENGDVRGEAFNVCTGKPTNLVQLAAALRKLMNIDGLEPEIVGRFRSGDIRHCFGDGSKLAARGWTPKRDLETGLADLVEWSREQESADLVQRAHEELESRRLLLERGGQ